VARVLSRLSARHGVFAVLGNHDFAVRNALGIRRYRQLHQRVADALHHHGIEVLRNRSRRLERGDSHLHLVGVDDLWSRACDLGQAFSGLAAHVPALLLAHNPRTIERIGSHRCDLILSGHTHGGQINWPGLGRVLLRGHGRRFAAGLYRHENRHLYVNRGVGFGFRFRFGVRPEMALMQLHRSKEDAV
jgi:predicted MPP superfamily phosphohydrolase